MLGLLTAVVFLGALLLFMVQPMAAKQVLPLLGGSPAVWNTAMVFFQAALLAGYAASHWVSRLGRRGVTLVPLVVFAAGAATLPMTIPAWDPSAAPPALWVLGALAVAVGLPFVALSMTSPIVQAWLSRTDHRSARDPYFLYAASNAGSFLGLLGYPIVVEPLLDLTQQRWAWSIGYGALAVLAMTGGVAAHARMRGPVTVAAAGLAGAEQETVSWGRRARWVLLAFIPSSYMLGVTQHVTTDIAAVPLLWVLPLAIYLLTFVAAFAGRAPRGLESVSRLYPVVVVSLAVAMLVQARQPFALLVAIHLAGLAMAAYLCHGRLAKDRPGAGRLTEFYLLLAVGGVLGGLFNGIVAPLLFNDVYEYAIAIVLASGARLPTGWGTGAGTLSRLARGMRPRATGDRGRSRWMGLAMDFTVPVIVLLTALVLGPAVMQETGYVADFVRAGLPSILCFLFVARPLRFAVGTAVLLSAAEVLPMLHRDVVLQRRTFFGVLRVSSNRSGEVLELRHGTTLHGMQITIPGLQLEPTNYYHRTSPIGDVMRLFNDEPRFDAVGIIGLGVGSMAAYGRPGQTIDFYEIDPAVVWIARDWGRFTFLELSRADEIRCIVGDGRIRLAEAPDGAYGLLVVDAFSSDAVPIHLITREAIELYVRKLRPDGLLALHISNRHLDLGALVESLAADAGLAVRINRDGEDFMPAAEQLALQMKQERSMSIWAVLARDEAALGALADRAGWAAPTGEPRVRPWTDGYSNVLAVFDWRADLRLAGP